MPPEKDYRQPDRLLVCGLGSLGQHCVAALKEFGVLVNAIDRELPSDWEIPTIPDLIVQGDCRHASALERADVRRCRAVLLVTDNENDNIEAAFAARLLNPNLRLVVRSNKQNLNQLLAEHLGNFIAFEPTLLAADAFAVAALGEEILGFFNLDGQLMRVVKYVMRPGDAWCDRPLVELNSSTQRVLCHLPAGRSVAPQFHGWDPEAKTAKGDTLYLLELARQATRRRNMALMEKDFGDRWEAFWQGLREWRWADCKRQIGEFWTRKQHQSRRVVLISFLSVAVLLSLGTLFFAIAYPNLTLRDALNATTGLLLGEYSEVVGGLRADPAIPWWLVLFSLGLTIAGTAFVGVLYALVTEQLLTSRFQFATKRPPIPQQDHIITIGLGRVGKGVAAWLQEFGQTVVGISTHPLDPEVLPTLPVVAGDLTQVLARANVAQAKSAILATDDEMQNLELGLLVHAANPKASLVIRTLSQEFSDNLAQLLPYAQVMSAYALAAEAFAGAAFGENIEGLFRLGRETVLVTEYRIEAGDTLKGLLLSGVAYGYGVMPLLYESHTDSKTRWVPSDDILLEERDRLTVLATIEGLRRIEQGELLPRGYAVWVEHALTADAKFDGASAIARITGCSLSVANEVIRNLPAKLPVALYPQQAYRLVRQLSRNLVQARVTPF